MMRYYRGYITTVGQNSPEYLNKYMKDIIDKILQTDTIKTIGDIGCGTGFHANLLKKQFSDIKFIGVDFSKAVVDTHQNGGNKIFDEIYLASSAKLPIDDKYFDIAISMENLEHLFYEEILDALYELKRTGKYIIITTPTPKNVVHVPFLTREIYEATCDPIPLNKHDYLCLEACIHKSTISPTSLIEAGFTGVRQDEYGDYAYYAKSEDIDLDKIRIKGIKKSSLLDDSDYKEKYLDLLHKSFDLDTEFLF